MNEAKLEAEKGTKKEGKIKEDRETKEEKDLRCWRYNSRKI
jgi:hypothetical protein